MPHKRCGSDWPPFTGTSPKSLSSHLSDRAHMRGRVPRLACYTRRRSGKPREHRGNNPDGLDKKAQRGDRNTSELGHLPAQLRAEYRRHGPFRGIRDQDGIYGVAVARRLRAMGIRDKPIAPGSPWQNAFAERLIGSIRRECVDHMVVLGEAHLRRVLKSYARYYNESRIHRALSKDAPFPRAVERLGVITSQPVLGGLHHQYCRI
jgi:Integrase core domain